MIGYIIAWGYPRDQDIYAKVGAYHFVLEEFQEICDMVRVHTTALVNDGRNQSLTGLANERTGDDSSTKVETTTAQTPAVITKSPKRDPGNLPENNGKKWTKAEENALLVLFLQGMELEDIGIKLGRSSLAITKRFLSLSPPIAIFLNQQATEIKSLKAALDEQAVIVGRLAKELKACHPKAGA